MTVENFFADRAHGLREAVPSKERRRAPRHLYRLPLAFSVFNRDQFFEGCMVNYGRDGVCAEIGLDIRPGTSVHLRIDEHPAAGPEGVACHCFRTTALGEVKWRRASGQGPPQRYHIGIRYYPYY